MYIRKSYWKLSWGVHINATTDMLNNLTKEVQEDCKEHSEDLRMKDCNWFSYTRMSRKNFAMQK